MAPEPPSAPDWPAFFSGQVAAHEAHLVPRRITEVHRARLTGLSATDQVRLTLPARANTGEYAVGDWVLADPVTHLLIRRLDRSSLLQRRLEGQSAPQLAAANVDTLFIVTSCNDEFNPARLERFLALANEAGTTPVIVLTKADMAEDAEDFRRQASALQHDLPVVLLDAKSPEAGPALLPWCGPGQTVVLVGASGVGKSTLVNTLAGLRRDDAQATAGIRENDAKGRHTTTARSLHPLLAGGWIIDTPGIRDLHTSHVTDGIDTVFAEIIDLGAQCRFRDCTHAHEPGCAVQAAIKAGTLSADRVDRWRKLSAENRAHTPVMSGPRGSRSLQKQKY